MLIPRHPLIPILILAFSIRVWKWISVGGLFIRDGSADMDGYLAVGMELLHGRWPMLSNYRPTQILYPILLLPVHFFKIPVPTYVFFLHQLLALILVTCAFQIGRIAVSRKYGILLAVLTAVNPLTLTWFHWMWTETVYHCMIGVFVLASVVLNKQPSWFHGVCCLIAAALLMMVKPEAISIVGMGFIYFTWALLESRRNARFATVAVLVSLFSVGLSFCLALGFYPPFRRKVFTHIHVAHGLWLSTRTGANPHGQEQDKAYNDLQTFLGQPGRIDPALNDYARASYLAMSTEGMRVILDEPIRYLGLAVKRAMGLLFPGLFWDGWSLARRAIDFLTCLFFTIGSVLAFRRSGSGEIRLISLYAFSMTAFVAFYLADGDLRFRIPIYLVLSFSAPIGWWSLVRDRLTVAMGGITRTTSIFARSPGNG